MYKTITVQNIIQHNLKQHEAIITLFENNSNLC